jgi:hypothetical protein
MDMNLSNGFLQLITKATRIQGTSYSLIDHILSNSNLKTYRAGVIISDISDHFINFIELPTHYKHNYCKQNIKRNLSNENIERFRISLQNLNWNNVTMINDTNESFDEFWQTFQDLYVLHFPIKRTRFNKNVHRITNYMTAGLLISRSNKNKLHKISLTQPTEINRDNYIAYRNMYNKLIKLSKKLYFEDNIKKSEKNSKKTWDLLKEATNLNQPNAKIDKIITNGVHITDNKQMAGEFNNFFIGIGQQISESVIPTKIKPEDYLIPVPNLPNLDFNTIGPSQIIDIIKLLAPKKSLDIDGISTDLIKKLSFELSVPLSHIFSLSLQTGNFPDRLKTSRTVPVFKAGNPESCDNYRPIALLSSLSKILEKIVAIQLVNHLERNKLIYKHQYGFQRNKSTEHNLIHAVNYIGKAMNEGKFTVGVFFLLEKGF